MEEVTERRHAQGLKKEHFDTLEFTVNGLEQKTRDSIFHSYGFRVEDVRPLTQTQAWFFSGQEVVSADFYLQVLYKLEGFIEPGRFRDALAETVAQNPVLRTNFYTADGMALQVVLDGREIPLVFQSWEKKSAVEIDQQLENVMEADRRHAFDLQHDALLRLSVYCTGTMEYAVLVTQPLLIADGWDVRRLFARAMGHTEDRASAPVEISRHTFAEELQKRVSLDMEPARKYWLKLLDDLPEAPKLPGYEMSFQTYHQGASRLRIPQLDMDKLMEKTKGDKNFLAAILQTAWGLMLQRANMCDDVYYCLLLAKRQATLENMAEMAASFNVVPVRLQYPQPCRIGELVQRQLRQVMVSQPFSYGHHRDYQRLLGGKQNLFQHFLSFHGFFTETKHYSKSKASQEGHVVAVNSQDGQGMALGVYFHYDGERIIAEFLYHEGCFTRTGIEFLGNSFAYTLHAMLGQWDEEIYCLKKILEKRDIHVPASREVFTEMEICSFLQQVEIFRKLGAAELKKMAGQAAVQIYYANDAIVQNKDEQSLAIFIMEGKVIRSRDDGRGWYSMLDIRSERGMLNEYVLLEEGNYCITGEALSDRVVVLAIPTAYLRELILDDRRVSQLVFKQLFAELDKYQRRWMLS